MKVKLTTLLFITLALNLFMVATPQAANRINTINPISPFNDDLAVTNDCNYCHTNGHGGRSDVPGMLNHNESRYSKYLDNEVFPEGFQEKSLLALNEKNKCPRNLNNRESGRILRGIRMQINQ